ncbi:interferon-induced protein 44-like isoform X1 [Dreissena polymorpha]|nr:interferon-induced protein 44-like isoform X1 [Dreissena polymorpha]
MYKMTGQLRDSDKTQLEQWINQGPKNFTLLFRATSDGCSSQIFHQKCDYQGATITVAYNQQGSVFGGYTSASWAASVASHIRDDRAFLFQLKYSGSDTRRKFPVSKTAYSIYSHASFGPIFGQNDMYLFQQTIQNIGGVFSMDGTCAFGVCYTMTGVTSWNDIHNGDMKATDIEVYSVAAKPPEPNTNQKWRKVPEWNKKSVQELIQEALSIKPNPCLKIQDYRIVLIGPVGSGKSSFCNTINSVFRGRITQRAICGEETHSITTAYKPYSIKSNRESKLNIRLCDTRGLETDLGMDIMEFAYLLNGHIPEKYKFNAEQPIAIDDAVFITKPGLQDKIHCVVFVLDASNLHKLDSKIMDKIKSFRKAATRIEIPQAVLLTKIDIEEKALAQKYETVYSNSSIEKKVIQVSEMLGFPKNHVFPVKNYENEVMLDDGVNLLALLALRQILYFAEDYMENQSSDNEDFPVKDHDFEAGSESI